MKQLTFLASALVISASAWAAPVQRSSIDAGTIIEGAVADQDWGRPLASGDLDGDGYDEFIVSACDTFGDFLSQVYILRGGPDGHRRGVVDLSTTGADQVIVGAAQNDNLGSSIAVGDVNGDGVDDLLVCASYATYGSFTHAGVAYLIYGGANFFDSATRNLAAAGTWDVRIVGPTAYSDLGGGGDWGGFDTRGAAIGNLNGDIYGDIVLGAHLADGGDTESGRVYVIMGEAFPSGTFRGLAATSHYDVRIDGQGEYDVMGDVVLTADLTGDGIDELIIGNSRFSQFLFDSEGAVHIYRGRTSWPTYFSLASTTADITILGNHYYGSLGEDAATGDVNSDGLPDLVVAAPGADAGAADTDEGIVYMFYGTTAWQKGTHLIDLVSATPDLMIVGDDTSEGLGSQVAVADFNGDGYDDIAASERFAGPNVNGVVGVLFGREFAPQAEFDFGTDMDVRIMGEAQDRFGFSLGAADVNDDGIDEVTIGTPFNNGPIAAPYGTAYVFSLIDGDFDGDGDQDLGDLAELQRCFTSYAGDIAPPCYVFDFNADQVLDLTDFAVLTEYVTGPQ